LDKQDFQGIYGVEKMKIIIEQTFFEPVPTGKYPAKITEIEETEGMYGLQLKFTFELSPEVVGEPRSLIGWTSKKFSNKSKLFRWTKAALGPIDRSYQFDSDDLIGRKVNITVVEVEGDDGVYNKIEDVSPFNNGPQKPISPPEYDGDW
jgi:hypothetical protein